MIGLDSSKEEVKEVARRANDLLWQIADIRRRKDAKQAQLDKHVADVQKKYGVPVEDLKHVEKALIDELVQLVGPLFHQLVAKGTKTIKLRSGSISLRKSSRPTLMVNHPGGDAAIIKRLASLGGLKQFTSVPKRILNKEALKLDPELVARINGVEIVQKTSMIIKPTKVQGEIIVTPDPLTISLPNEGD
jgi:phage host-nuclease inhibitor protein Gam